MMRRFSARAARMIARGTWHAQPRARDEVRSLLAAAGIVATKEVLDFQEHLGGLEYQARGHGAWRFGVFPLDPSPPALEEGMVLIVEGRLEAQFFFSIDASGRICVLAPRWLRIASGATAIIESDAVIDEIADVWSAGVFVPLGRLPDGGDLMAKLRQVEPGLETLAEASDSYTRWLVNDRARINTSVFYDSLTPGDAAFAYTRDLETACRLVTALTEQGAIVRSREVIYRSHPSGHPVHREAP